MPQVPSSSEWCHATAPSIAPGGDDVHIWRIDLDEPRHDRAALHSTLTTDEVMRAERFVFARDRERFVVARGLLRVILGRYTGIDAAAVRFGYTAHGRPMLSHAGRQDLDFNLSHSDRFALVAVAANRRVGVDLEKIRESVDYLRIADDMFAPAERQALRALPEQLRRTAFFAGWTRKEAYVKALGGGLAIPLNGFDVTLGPDEPPMLRAGADAGARWSVYALHPADGYAAAIVAEGQPVRLQRFDILP